MYPNYQDRDPIEELGGLVTRRQRSGSFYLGPMDGNTHRLKGGNR